MSQQKVDRHKLEKKNREKIQKKERRILMLEKLIGGAICLAVVGWIGYSAYGLMERAEASEEKEVVTTEMDVTAINDFITELSQTAEEE